MVEKTVEERLVEGCQFGNEALVRECLSQGADVNQLVKGKVR